MPAVGLLLDLLFLACAGADDPPRDPRLDLRVVRDDAGETWRGTFRVPEDREHPERRELELDVVVLKATGPAVRPDPLFFLAGGPGQSAAAVSGRFASHWARAERDVVCMSQRGTGRHNRLDLELPGSDDDLQGYLEPIFDAERVQRSRETLERRWDLRQYSTPIATDDYDELRQALGYERINLMGGSYGTRACLIYMRRHPDTVRAAILNGVAPLSFTNPLYHARSAQRGLEQIFEEVEADPAAREAYPGLRERFAELMERLEREPVDTTVEHPSDGSRQTIRLSAQAFAEALRVLMYYTPTNRQVPYLLDRAMKGDFSELARRGIEQNRSLRDQVALGMLLCVTCAEDVDRIPPELIDRMTRDTFLGDQRVKSQRAACELWPRSELPEGYAEPVELDLPVLIWSGTHDPVTPPEYGQVVAEHFPNSLHLIVPGAHGVSGDCVDSIEEQFLDEASVAGVRLGCIASMRMPPFRLPDAGGSD